MRTLSTHFTAIVVTAVIAALVLFAWTVYSQSGRYEATTYKTDTMLNATTSDATSTVEVIAGAKAVTWYFTNESDSSGNGTSTFSVQVSADNSTWVTYNKLVDNVTNTNSQDLTRVGSVEMSGDQTKTLNMPLADEGHVFTRCISDLATSTSALATSTCKAVITK